MIDRFTRWMEAVPLASISAEIIAKQFFSTWVSRYGVPEAIVSDQGTQFESFIFNRMLSFLGIKRFRTTAYHPQANGLIERAHSTLKNSLRCLVGRSADWETALPVAMMAIRSAFNELNTSPALLLFGEPMSLPSSLLSNESSYDEKDC